MDVTHKFDIPKFDNITADKCRSMNDVELNDLQTRIINLMDERHNEIIHILRNENVTLTENNNGYFVNLSYYNTNNSIVLWKLLVYVEYAEAQEAFLNKVEEEKKRIIERMTEYHNTCPTKQNTMLALISSPEFQALTGNNYIHIDQQRRLRMEYKKYCTIKQRVYDPASNTKECDFNKEKTRIIKRCVKAMCEIIGTQVKEETIIELFSKYGIGTDEDEEADIKKPRRSRKLVDYDAEHNAKDKNKTLKNVTKPIEDPIAVPEEPVVVIKKRVGRPPKRTTT